MSGAYSRGLAPVRNPASRPPAAERGACLSPAVLGVQTLEAEDEFERSPPPLTASLLCYWPE